MCEDSHWDNAEDNPDPLAPMTRVQLSRNEGTVS